MEKAIDSHLQSLKSIHSMFSVFCWTGRIWKVMMSFVCFFGLFSGYRLDLLRITEFDLKAW